MDQIRTIGGAQALEHEVIPDVIGELSHQHARIVDLVAEVRRSTGLERLSSFEELREFLIMHETAEQIVVRPVVAAILGLAEPHDRNLEEERAQELLSEATRCHDGAEDMLFLMSFAALESELGAHTAREEGDEWAALAYGCNAEQRARMGRQLRAASASVRGRRALRDPLTLASFDPKPEPLALIVERTYRAINDAA